MKKNDVLKAAFEEVAKTEINNLPEEGKIIRPYTDEFCERMEGLFKADEVIVSKKKLRFSKVAVVAAVLTVMLTFTTSALLTTDGWSRLLKIKPDPERYQKTEIEAEAAYDNDETFVEKAIRYTGEPISFKYSVDTGETWDLPDRGIMVFIDGVRQEFTAKIASGEQKDIGMLYLENEPGTEKEFEITLQPNIGEKGDEMYLSIVEIYDPYVSFYTQCDSKYKQLMPMHYDDDGDEICDKCSNDFTYATLDGPPSLTAHSEGMFKVIMEKDASSQTFVAEGYSGLKTDVINKKIYNSYYYEDGFGEKHNEYDEMEALAAVIYKDVKDSYIRKRGVDYHVTRIETKGKENDDFIINLHGAAGKYRISLYVNNEMQKAFDGSYYTDVDVASGNQTELAISVDTSKLIKGDNYFYVMYEKLDGELDVFREVMRGQIYTVEVK